MKTWQQAMQQGLVSGSIASLASTVVLSACGAHEEGTAYAPTNATSHWLWGDQAKHRDEPSVRFTLTGYAIHHASSCFWAVIYEKWLGSDAKLKALRSPLASGAAIASLACFVDYKLTPGRLRPGFEQRLSKPSLFLAYAGFGLALGMRGMLAKKRDAGAS